ncbi:superoxide dismutase [Caulobacter sp. KR2-114]|uniref:superoxide dismutase n=1 Tax=Caulobacter sp. KR2-114 TaxID=3400912 RepID=UPI003C033210
MSEPLLDRRHLMASATLLGAGALIAAGSAHAQPPPAFGPTPKALPFDPGSIAGLSDKLLISHHDNNYLGAVKRLGAISAEFAGLDPATAPGYRINGLKREELIAWNSMILHEVYFAGLGAPSQPGPKLAAALERDFGSVDRWRGEFSAMGKALGGGSGWVLLTWSHRDGRLVNQWAADHTMALAGSTPVLALDMYEHAYAIDYGAKAAAYVDAFMKIINWSSADAAFAKASG